MMLIKSPENFKRSSRFAGVALGRAAVREEVCEDGLGTQQALENQLLDRFLRHGGTGSLDIMKTIGLPFDQLHGLDH